MGIFKALFSKRVVSVLDCGTEHTVVLIGRRKSLTSWQILGAGDSKTQGLDHGEVVHLGDAVESIVEAIQKAESASQEKVDTLYFNFDDAEIQSLRVSGCKSLRGDGEIVPEDVLKARQVAQRHVELFDRNVIYSADIGFTIDGRDIVDNALGLYGSKLEVLEHFLLARSEHFELWQKILNRSGLERVLLVPSAWSTAYGILRAADRVKRRLVLDGGKDFITLFTFEKNKITNLRVLPIRESGPSVLSDKILFCAKEMFENSALPEEILVTGDLAQEAGIWAGLKEFFNMPISVVMSQGIPGLNQTKFSSLAGLLDVADQMQRETPFLNAGNGLWSNTKEKAASFIQEYF